MKDMHYYEVAPNQIVRIENTFFTYSSDTPLSRGQIVRIEVGKKLLVGVVLAQVQKPPYQTKTVHSVLEDNLLPRPLIGLALWLSHYYMTHLAIVLQTILPRGLDKTRRQRTQPLSAPLTTRTKNVLTPTQQHAVDVIEHATPGTIMLHGVTGSGKTRVYIEMAKRTLERGRSVIVLVPEIALTSQLIHNFAEHFDTVILTHSRQTEAERHAAWREALDSTSPRVVIGPRSALFLPLASIGLIVIDEAHEPSFKQEQSPRYSALRAASILASHHKAKLMLGSATPSVADYYIATNRRRPIIQMTKRAQPGTLTPDITLIDMTQRTNFKKHRFLSDKLLAYLEETLADKGQVLVFHNRRGSANTTLCENCGWTAGCPRCFIPLTLHTDIHQLRCHICGLVERIPTECPLCHSINILHKGIGTKLIETELRKLFPHKIIARFDGDTKTSDSVEQNYSQLYNGEIDIIIGTQVIAKGLDLPKLRTVGVVQADAGLNLPDFGSTERTFQLLAQVIGRVGRTPHPTRVVVQSYQPTHPAIVDGLAQNYEHFYQTTLKERQRGYFPPFAYLLKVTCVYKTEAATIKNAKKLADTLRSTLPSSVQILGPAPAFYERQHDTYRWQLIVKSSQRSDLTSAIALLPSTHWQFELDPFSLL